jgi:Uncharacterized ACR, COG1678
MTSVKRHSRDTLVFINHEFAELRATTPYIMMERRIQRRRINSSQWNASVVLIQFVILETLLLKCTTHALSITTKNPVRSGGTGPDAVVRLGTVLVAPKEEYHHFYREAAIFLYDMGHFYEETPDEYIIRGLILDHPTPFTVGEMIPNTPEHSWLSTHKVFRGGDQGKEDSVLLLHNQPSWAADGEIGSTGLHLGGWNHAATADDVAAQAKVFFNYCEFTEAQIEAFFADPDKDDPWMAVEVDPALVLNNDWGRGDCWRYLRNSLVQLRQK